jgi:hypothetical protein
MQSKTATEVLPAPLFNVVDNLHLYQDGALVIQPSVTVAASRRSITTTAAAGAPEGVTISTFALAGSVDDTLEVASCRQGTRLTVVFSARTGVGSTISGPFIGVFSTTNLGAATTSYANAGLASFAATISNGTGVRAIPQAGLNRVCVLVGSPPDQGSIRMLPYPSGTATTLEIEPFDASGSTSGSTCLWDACNAGHAGVNTTTGFYVVVADPANGGGAAGAGCRVGWFNSVGKRLGTTTLLATATCSKVAICRHSGTGNIYVATVSSAGGAAPKMRVWRLGASLTQLSGPTLVATAASSGGKVYSQCMNVTIGEATSSAVLAAASFAGTFSGNPMMYTHVATVFATDATLQTTSGFIYHHRILSKPMRTGKWGPVMALQYVGAGADRSSDHSWLVRVQRGITYGTGVLGPKVPNMGKSTTTGNGLSNFNFKPIAKFATDVAGGTRGAVFPIELSTTVTATPATVSSALWCSLSKRLVKDSVGFREIKDRYGDRTVVASPVGKYAAVDGVDLNRVWAADYQSMPLVDMNDVDLIASGVLLQDVRGELSESPMYYAPSIYDVHTSGTQTTSYGFKAVYEYGDGLGRVHRSRPSYVTYGSVTNLATNTGMHVYVTDPNYHVGLWNRKVRSGVKTTIYRTVAGKTGLYRRGVIANSGSNVLDVPCGGGLRRIVIKNNTLNTEPLYAEGGDLVPTTPPSFRHLIAAKGRLWGISAEDPTEIWFSKYVSSGQSPEWSTIGQIFGVDGEGPFTALAAIDDKIIAFKKAGVFYIYGEGPNNLGTGGAFTGPLPLPNTAGCENSKSVLATEMGVLFQGPAGFYLLDRNLQLHNVGEPIRRFFTPTAGGVTTTVVGVALDLERKQFHVGIKLRLDPETDRQVNDLVWDYARNVWFTWCLRPGSGSTAISTTSISEMYTKDGRVHFRRGSSATATTYTFGRASNAIGNPPSNIVGSTYQTASALIETGWLHLGNIGGFARCYKVGIQATRQAFPTTATYASPTYTHVGGTFEMKLYFDNTTTYVETYTLTGLSARNVLRDFNYAVVPARRKFTSIKVAIKGKDLAASAGWLKLYALTFEVGLRPNLYPYRALGTRG